MKKLKLNLDEIKVESFQTVQALINKGTVLGNDEWTVTCPPDTEAGCATEAATCPNTCVNTCAATCPNTCIATCVASCNGTCDGTCGCTPSWDGTCEAGCTGACGETQFCPSTWPGCPPTYQLYCT